MLSLRIDGDWEPEDFIDVLQSVESLYYKAAFQSPPTGNQLLQETILFRTYSEDTLKSLDLQNQEFVAKARMLAPQGTRIGVKKISYASPGGIDFVGIGRVMESIDRIVGRLLDFYADRHMRKERDEQARIDTEIKRQNLRSIQIENAREYLEGRRGHGEAFDDAMLLLVVRDQDALAKSIAEGRITGSRNEPEKSDLPAGFGEW